ncbi:MAG TPA: deoxyribodipyrimidine photo-lyase [Candidatus Omnitrophota bacterium]|nr:deoxyribodipyrimidine photo-lyase [Candidatus Omnitrophota bacterium]
MNPKNTIVCFRNDLRLEDNPAFLFAAGRGGGVVPVFIWAPEEEGAWAPGAASRWWLARSLESLRSDLNKKGLRLIVRKGGTVKQLARLVREADADCVVWNRRYEPAARKREREIERHFRAKRISVLSFNASFLYAPGQIKTKTGKPFQVFTPFWNACLTQEVSAGFGKVPSRIQIPLKWPQGISPDRSGLYPPCADWAAKFERYWEPGAGGALKQLKRFLRKGLSDYQKGRDIPSDPGTSRLSPHLHFGEISPKRVWREVFRHAARAKKSGMSKTAEVYLRQLVWREFAGHLLYHFPETPERPLREKFSRFIWREDGKSLKAWQKGRTGYPIVDAGMRELWETGWMHNRVRMIAGSFLVKDLLISWTEGARWFWDTLVDADLANNTLGWQWVAGCGADAAPYFRIFNPVLQGERFDPFGKYIRRWVPELSKLPDAWIHKPWQAPAEVLEAAGVEPGKTYPRPIADHAVARQRALAVFSRI